MPNSRHVARGHRRGRHGDVGAAGGVRLEDLAEVHDVELVAGEHQDAFGAVPQETVQLLADGVGSALIPVHAGFGLLRGEDLDEAVRERIEAIGARDVTVQRRRLKLREHEDVAQAGVDAVADRDVDQPILAGERHRRLAA